MFVGQIPAPTSPPEPTLQNGNPELKYFLCSCVPIPRKNRMQHWPVLWWQLLFQQQPYSEAEVWWPQEVSVAEAASPALETSVLRVPPRDDTALWAGRTPMLKSSPLQSP